MTEAIKSTVVMPPPQDGARDPVDGRPTPDPAATTTVPAAVPVPRPGDAGEPAVPVEAEEAPDAAWDLFGDDFANHVSGLARDADAAERSAREQLSRGHGVDMAVALRALAAEARQRGRDDGVIGSALRGLGIDVTAAHLDAVADQMAAIGKFDLVEVIGPGDETTGDEDLVASARADAVDQFDLLAKNHLTPELATEVPQPPADLADERFPLDLQERDLRTRGLLAITWRRQIDEVRQSDPSNLPVQRALALAVLLIEDRSERGSFPMTQFARTIVGTDSTPLHTGARLRQLAALLDEHLPDRRVQSQVLSAVDGLSPAGKLSAVAREIERIATAPAERAQARVAGAFVTAKQRAVRDRERGGSASAPVVPSQAAAVAAGSYAAALDSATGPTEAAGTSSPDETSTQFDPDLPMEQALLGSLLNAPAAIGKIEKLLGARDFSNPEMRVVYEALRALNRSGGLYDVVSMPTEAKRLSAAQENHVKLFEALQRSLVPHSLSRRDIQRLVAEINAAAPAASVPFRGVFDPAAQFRLARKVWETGFSRRLAAMAVQMDRGKPLISPERLVPDRSARSARSARNLAATLTTIDGQLDAMSAQLASAVRRSGVDADGQQAASAVIEASRSWRMPDPLRPVLAPLRHRAERHVLHLALHAGHMESIPQAILDLQPEHFGSERHANLWRTIKDVQSRGEPVNWVSVHWETRAPDFAHRPMPSVKELAKLGAPPEVDHGKVRRSLGLVVSSALARAKADVQGALVGLADTSTVPTEAGIAAAQSQVRNLRAQATTAAEQLEQTSAMRASTRPHPPRLHPGEPLTRVGGPRA
ncbi:DnaB-like helicase N-terminal domain-containing protein [Lentzea sp. NPDC092896]|uniref:DnaB-like helicase N-terminal domain-containing protein n=1 Tax=Lentzea sp. NPDC092896 TaxID=3364127 RepID=UPI00380319A0